MKLSDVKPLHNLALLRERTNSSGSIIHTPDNASAENRVHEVMAVGPGIYTDQGNRVGMQLSVGDIVMIVSGNYGVLRIDGIKHLLVPEDNVRCVVGRAETWDEPRAGLHVVVG